MATEAELLAAVYQAPDDDAARLVYADWLTDNGSSLGEFITLQIARASKGKRTQRRERALLASDGALWWPGHPVWFEQALTIPWAATDRGFPASFNVKGPVSLPGTKRRAEALEALVGAQAWATVTKVQLYFDEPGRTFVRLLTKSPLVALKRLAAFGADGLGGVGALSLPIEDLELWNRDGAPLARITGLPKLQRLTVDVRVPLDAAVPLTMGCGVIDRLERLELRGVTGKLDLALEVFKRVPQGLGSLHVNQYYGQTIELRGKRSAPEARLSVTAAQVPEVAQALSGLEKSQLSAIEIEFAQYGHFNNKNTPALRAQIDAAIKRWR